MTVSKLRSGRYRAQVWRDGKWVAVADVIGGERSFATKKEAHSAKRKAQLKLESTPRGPKTLRDFWEQWTTDPLFERPKESTNRHNAERTRAFVEKFGDTPIALVGDPHVASWLAGGKRNGTVRELRAMFNDAMSAKAGRLVASNPFAGLGLSRQRGNKYRQPPSEETIGKLLVLARELTPPSFAAWLEVACYTAMRPGEVDALQWSQIDWEAAEIHVTAQWSARIGRFDEPKYGPYTITLVARAREALLGCKRDMNSQFCFTTTRGKHYTPSTRTHHWNRVRCAAGLADTSLYLATRHYFASYALNVLELPPHVVAQQLGHRDGGRLIVELYGHPDKFIARRKIREAFDTAAQVHPLRVHREDTA